MIYRLGKFSIDSLLRIRWMQLEFFEKSKDNVHVEKLRSSALNAVGIIFTISDRKVSKNRSEDIEFSDIRVSDFLRV